MRLFVALELPEAIRVSILQFVEELRNAVKLPASVIRWTRDENLHVTLKFLGEIPELHVASVQDALAEATSTNSIQLGFGDFGFFPNHREPRVFWLGVDGGAPLLNLAGAIDAALQSLAIPREKRPLFPHLTLARFTPSFGVKQFNYFRQKVSAAGTLDLGVTFAKAFHLYRSVLKPTGAEYTQLSRYDLNSGGKAR